MHGIDRAKVKVNELLHVWHYACVVLYETFNSADQHATACGRTTVSRHSL